MKRSLALFLMLLVLLGSVPASAAEPAQGASTQAPYAGIVVKFKAGPATALGVASLGAKRLRPGIEIYTLPPGRDPAAKLNALRVDPRVEWAEPDYIAEPAYSSTPNDPYFLDPKTLGDGSVTLAHLRSWQLRGYGSIHADAVWPFLESADTTQYGARGQAADFPVAVIDTGFYMDHPDRGPNIVVGKDCFATYSSETDTLTTDYDVTPDSTSAPKNSVMIASHGTCVAGEIAAATDNGVGNAGSGYDTLVRIYKVQGIWIEGDTSNPGEYPPGSSVMLDTAIANSIYQATDDGCKVINLSLGQSASSTLLQDAVNYAHAHGVVVVAATGNGASASVLYPARCTYAIGVGSYTVPDNTTPGFTYVRSAFTNYGTGLDVLAPGRAIWGFFQPGYDADGEKEIYAPGYYIWDGTSMASPLVAGGIATLWRLMPALSADEIADYATRLSAHDMGVIGYDTANGYGAFDLEAARQRLVADYPELAAPSITARPSAETSATAGTVSWSAVSGHTVGYDVTVDGVTTNTFGTSRALSSLGEGTHQVRVTAKSARNWWSLTRSSSSFSFLVDTTAPAAPAVGTSGLLATWATPPADVVTVEVRVDGGGAVALTGSATSYYMPGLTAGAHYVEVRFLDSVRNFSAWTRRDFTVTSTNQAPEAHVQASPASGYAPLDVHFTSTGSLDADGEIVAYAWDFGDGGSASGPSADHTYALPGSYTVKLTVTDDSGAQTEAQQHVVVSAVVVAAPPVPVYRFYRPSTGTHFYTADASEKDFVLATMSATYSYDGIGYYINQANASNSVPLYRFYNRRSGTHLYTADEAEAQSILGNLGGTYSLDGVAYHVSMTSGLQVHRFYSPARGVHFYSADPNEIAYVRANLAHVWQYEGPAYFVGQ